MKRSVGKARQSARAADRQTDRQQLHSHLVQLCLLVGVVGAHGHQVISDHAPRQVALHRSANGIIGYQQRRPLSTGGIFEV